MEARQMVTSMQLFLEETTPGRAYFTVNVPGSKHQVAVDQGPDYIGPFSDRLSAAAWLAENMSPFATYRFVHLRIP